jgi:Leucine-rich repeat (LRR) protein
LKTLALSSNKLRTLPQSIGGLKSLTTLNLDHNNLVSLPDSITRYGPSIVNLCYNDSLIFTPRQKEWLGVTNYPEYYQKYCVTEIENAAGVNKLANPVSLTLIDNKIKYSLLHNSAISLTVYTLHGAKLATIESGFKKSGVYTISIAGLIKNKGIYVFTLKTDVGVISKRWVIVR